MAGGGAVAGGILKALPVIGEIASELRKQIPRLEDEVTVRVEGQPGSTKKQLYYLGLSVACSLVRRYEGFFKFISPPPGMLMLEYDAADHWVQVTLRFNTSLLAAAIAQNPGGFVMNPVLAAAVEAYMKEAGRGLGLYGQLPIYCGPLETIKGSEFNFTDSVASIGIPSSAKSAGAPQLPWMGRTILTTASTCPAPYPGSGDQTANGGGAPIIPTPNPKPPGDNRSRGVVFDHKNPLDPYNGLTTGTVFGLNEQSSMISLVALVTTALTDPGGATLEGFAPPFPGPTGG